MDNGITRLRQYGPVNTEYLLAIIAHFGICDNVAIDADAPETKWTGDKELVNGKEYYSTFITAAIEHVTTCQAAQTEFAHFINSAATEETIVTATAGQPEPIAPLPAALDIETNVLPGVILVVNINGNDQHFDLLKVAEMLPRMQLTRVKTANVATMQIVRAEDWQDREFDAGEQLDLHQITGNGQYLVVGEWSYPVEDVRELLARNGGHLTVEYVAPAWYHAQPQQGRHAAGLTQEELNATSGQLLPDRTHGVDTGLTELPASDVPFVDDEESDRTEYLIERDGIWPSLRRYWIVVFLGFTAGIFTAGTITFAAHHHFTMIWSVVIGLVTSVSITCGAGVLGSLVAVRTFIEPELTNDEHQAWVFHGGTVIGWMLLVLTDLTFLL